MALTLDQAIEHAQEAGEQLSSNCETKECGLEHIQLANWLRELKDLRQKNASVQGSFDSMMKQVRIDDIKDLKEIVFDANATIDRIWNAYNPIERASKDNFICEAIRKYYEKHFSNLLI